MSDQAVHQAQAVHHSEDILKAADNFYRGTANEATTVQKLNSVFQEAIKDGSVQELIAEMHYPRGYDYTTPSVEVDGEKYGQRRNDAAPAHTLYISPGILEEKGPATTSNAFTEFRVETDKPNKTAAVKAVHVINGLRDEKARCEIAVKTSPPKHNCRYSIRQDQTDSTESLTKLALAVLRDLEIRRLSQPKSLTIGYSGSHCHMVFTEETVQSVDQ